MASWFRSMRLDCQQSYGRQVSMSLRCASQTLEVSFRVRHGNGRSSTSTKKCFEFGDLGPKRASCPHRQGQPVPATVPPGTQGGRDGKSEPASVLVGQVPLTSSMDTPPDLVGPAHSYQPLLHLQPPDEDENTTDCSLIITTEDNQQDVTSQRKRTGKKRKWNGGVASDSEEEMIDRELDQSLETKSKQHKLTTVNVRNILHEVITNEHVVAMMKAAINETEAVPPFELKMTRSKVREVLGRGGMVNPGWSISPIKRSAEDNKLPQFVDMSLAEEDSSDEEYHPDEEDEDETTEDTFHESDMESGASSPRGSRMIRLDEENVSPRQSFKGRIKAKEVESVSMGPPLPPKAPPTKAGIDGFLEKLHAVEAELNVCLEPYQPLAEEDSGVMACRTRSKRPLKDVPLGQLEAELRAPDITPDMYPSSAYEDKEWTDWLRGLMSSDMEAEEECDDEDDPEYNFLSDIDEPDKEDYRDDKAVRITRKEVNELMEELFETLKEDCGAHDVDDDGHDEEEELQEDMKASPGGEQPIPELRTVKQQLDFIRNTQQTHTLHTHALHTHTLQLNAQQKQRLQQQLQQHVQLLTQVHLLIAHVHKLHSEAETTRHFLTELDLLAQRAELIGALAQPGFRSAFRASNLQAALELLDELQQMPIALCPYLLRCDARRHGGFPVMPAELAWIFATRPVFIHTELLPCVSLDPAHYCPRRTNAFTAAEDSLLVLGLRNMEGSFDPPNLVSQFLLRKTLVQVRRRILQCCRAGSPDNIVKTFRYERRVSPMQVTCRFVSPLDRRPPVERSEGTLPLWLVRSLPIVHHTVKHYNSLPPGSALSIAAPPSCRRPHVRHSHLTFLRSAPDRLTFQCGTMYPPRLPPHLGFQRIGFVVIQQLRPQDVVRADDDVIAFTLTLSESSDDDLQEAEPEGRKKVKPSAWREAEEEVAPTFQFSPRRRLLCQLRRSLGENSALYQQTAFLFKRSSTPSPDDIAQVVKLLKLHPQLQQEVQTILQLHQTLLHSPPQLSPAPPARATGGAFTAGDRKNQEPITGCQRSRASVKRKTAVWTREEDHTLLTSCQQKGATRKTFQEVSSHLGTKTVRQVGLRFQHLLRIFQQSSSRSSDIQPISSQETAPH